jgi:hypothetical protein
LIAVPGMAEIWDWPGDQQLLDQAHPMLRRLKSPLCSGRLLDSGAWSAVWCLFLVGSENAGAVAVIVTFDELQFANNANNSIGNSYQSGGFTFSASGLFVRGASNAYYPGSGALMPTSGATITVTRTGGGAFRFYAADIAERDGGGVTNTVMAGIRADGTRINTTTRLDGVVAESENFGVAHYGDIISLQFSGSNQLDRLVLSNLVPPPPSSATLTFDAASTGTVAGSYSERGYQLSPSVPGSLAIVSTMNDSNGAGTAGAGTLTLTEAGRAFSLHGFDIHSQFGESGLFRLIVTDESGSEFVSSLFPRGTYSDTAITALFGGMARQQGITSARFENTTGEGLVVDNIFAIPEPASWFLASLGVMGAGLSRVRGNRLKVPVDASGNSAIG